LLHNRRQIYLALRKTDKNRNSQTTSHTTFRNSRCTAWQKVFKQKSFRISPSCHCLCLQVPKNT